MAFVSGCVPWTLPGVSAGVPSIFFFKKATVGEGGAQT